MSLVVFQETSIKNKVIIATFLDAFSPPLFKIKILLNVVIPLSICDIDFLNFNDRQVWKFKILKLSLQNWNSAVIFQNH